MPISMFDPPNNSLEPRKYTRMLRDGPGQLGVIL